MRGVWRQLADFEPPVRCKDKAGLAVLETGANPEEMDLVVDALDANHASLSNNADNLPKVRASVCFMVMVTDPDGNSLWIHKRKSGRG